MRLFLLASSHIRDAFARAIESNARLSSRTCDVGGCARAIVRRSSDAPRRVTRSTASSVARARPGASTRKRAGTDAAAVPCVRIETHTTGSVHGVREGDCTTTCADVRVVSWSRCIASFARTLVRMRPEYGIDEADWGGVKNRCYRGAERMDVTAGGRSASSRRA